MASNDEFGSRIEVDNEFDKKLAKGIICKFFTSEWPSVDPEKMVITRVSDGFSNTQLFVDRGSAGEKSQLEPAVVVLRFPGRSGINVVSIDPEGNPVKASWTEELLAVRQFALSGWGAKVYGVFAGGRVDEFIKGHTLTPTDVEDPLIRAEVAKSFARFHSMRLPNDKTRSQAFDNELLAYMDGLKEEAARRPELANFATVVDFDYGSDLREIWKRLDQMNARKTWCLVDMQYLNVLVRNDPAAGENRIVLIDFECHLFQYRAFDVGGHFLEKLIKWNGVADKRSGGKFYTEKEKRHFCSEYLKESAKVDPGSVDAEVDTVDHLMQEADLGFLLKMIWVQFGFLRYFSFLAIDPAFISLAKWLHDLYLKRRKDVFGSH